MSNHFTELHRARRARGFARLALALACGASAVSCTSGEVGALPANASEVVRIYAGECDEGVGSGCFALALLYSLGESTGHGVPADAARAEALRQKACALGHDLACDEDALQPPTGPGSASAPDEPASE